MLWLEIGQATTVWRIGSFGNTLWRDDEGRIGVFDQTPPKMGSSARPFGPRHSPLSPPLHENTTQMWARPCVPRLWASQMSQAPIIHAFDVRFAVSDMLRSTPTTLSVNDVSAIYWIFVQLQYFFVCNYSFAERQIVMMHCNVWHRRIKFLAVAKALQSACLLFYINVHTQKYRILEVKSEMPL